MDPYFYKITYRFKLLKRYSEKELLLIDNFLSGFQLLTPSQKKIYKVIWRFANWREHVFPERATIAKHAGCSVRTVSDAVRIFDENGWITRMKRGYSKSNLYFMFAPLKMIDVSRPKCFELIPGINIDDTKISLEDVNSEQVVERYEQVPSPRERPSALPPNSISSSYGNRFDSVRPFSVHKEMEQSFRKSYGHSIHVHDLPLKDSEKRILSRHEDYFLLRARTDILEQDKYSQIRNWGAAMEERAQVYKIAHEEKVHPQEARKRYLERREVRQRTKKKAA